MARLPRVFLLPLLCVSLTFGGCASSDGAGASDEQRAKAPSKEVQAFAGRFELHSRFDLTQSGLIPDLAAETLRSLSGLSENPSATMFELVAQANVPIAATVIQLMPGFLANIINDLINDVVFSSLFEALPVVERLTFLVEDIAKVFTEFEMVSILEIRPPDKNGNTTVSHKLVGLVFRLDGQVYTVSAPEVVSDLTEQTEVEANVAVLYEGEAVLEDGRLYLADHDFTLPVGALAVAGIDFALQKGFNVEDLEAALTAFIPCAAIGQEVASRCPLGACNSLGDAVTSLCDTALVLAANTVEASLLAIHLDLVSFSAGEAAFFDLSSEQASGETDGKMDRIERGHWSIQFGRGDDAVVIPGVFEGHRIPDNAEVGDSVL